jgi:DNA-binding transcriptional MerR regulator
MNKDVFTGNEFLQKAAISRETLAEWTKWKLIRPCGYAEDQAPLFSLDAVAQAAYIQKLYDLGYGPEEILKIVKKVGLPRERSGKKKPAEKDRYLTVGDLAERSGVSPRTIKHWEDKGIIEPDMRTEGGFRLYSEAYVFLCKLILDLQLFGYALEDIKSVSDHVRDFLAIQADLEAFPQADIEAKFEAMLREIQALSEKMKLLKAGIVRWEDLLKKKRKEILNLMDKNRKRPGPAKGKANA